MKMHENLPLTNPHIGRDNIYETLGFTQLVEMKWKKHTQEIETDREMERRDRKSNVENTVVLLSISDMSCRAQKHS